LSEPIGSHLPNPAALLAVTGVVSVALPWISVGDGSRPGFTQPDGRLTLLVGLLAVLLAWKRVRAGWIAAGFLAVLNGRNLLVLDEQGGASAAFGLWIAAVSFAVSAAVQVATLITGIRSRAVDQP
jgi:hypothetical protein